MKKNIFKDIYAGTPEVAKKAIGLIPFSLRMGKNYRKISSFLQISQYWSKEKIEKYQRSTLQEVLSHAYHKVPFYKDLFDSVSFNPNNFTNSDFERLPILSKDSVFDNFERMKCIDNNPFNSYMGVTGGTTGKPLSILFEMKTPFIEWAFIHSLWSRAKYAPDCKRLTVIGIPFKDHKGVDYKIEPFHNELQLSILNLDQKLHNLLDAITKFEPSFIYGYPSAVSILASRLEADGSILHGIRGILCGSENYSENQIALIERVFGSKYYSWYGQTEKVVLAGWCEHSREYHILPEYGFAELIDENDNVINESGVVGEIVGTGFFNRAMPLIRYRTGDLAEYACFDTCECGRNHKRLKKIVGRRNNEYLVGTNYERIPLSLVDTQQKAFENVYQMQFKQTEKGRASLFILNNRKIHPVEVNDIRETLNIQLCGKVTFDVKLVEELEKTGLGKTKICIQNVEVDFHAQ